ncbi:serine/threonine-protein kinase [Actinoplanes bogorensis]|uniref:non-specific serine/threonine protein kinase n=1 Tax=Paractinoplanes bogorensis TaxID=1610840 RepID=A0ABS5YXX3_9ACTN|nr:serine/threonine-protein kinase [Actinoplanes bogorensis]MBU2668293.1 serine/threonine-protein kinase [Actinoplanes bogorensis]
MPGRTLGDGRYELQSPLARGGMGEVWLGHDTRLDREIAVKFIRVRSGETEQEDLRRFLREAKITARLEHPGVPAVYDAGTDEQGRPFLVMQRVHGLSIADFIAEQGPLPIGWASAIAAQTCSVLAAAHAASLVHRDLKPGNLMLEPSGCVKVLDFGLAVAPTLADFSRITMTGQPIGTPAYMAPEQVEANLSEPATDLYALGCTLHEMLSGDHVFTGPTTYSVMTQQVKDRPPRLRSMRPDIPAEVERLVLDLLQKRPEDRPASALDVYDRLAPFAADLGPLPGVLAAPGQPSPVRMYAELVSRVSRSPTANCVSSPEPVTVAEPAREAAAVTRHDLAQARNDARQLAQESRFSQAAELLSDTELAARQVFGNVDKDVVRIRYELATALFEGGDYHRAAPVFEALAEDLDAGAVISPDLLFDCRVKQAICHAMTGRGGQALGELDALLADRRAAHGAEDPRTLDLRKQIALLQLQSGHHQQARRTLSGLLSDVRRLPGGTKPSPAEVADLLASIRSEDR